MEAQGIHDHDTLKLGLHPPKNAPALKLGSFLTGEIPKHPIACDHFGALEFGLYGNDKYGDCGPTSAANLLRLVSAALTGSEIQPSQDGVFDLYRLSGNPDFDPATGAGDNGVDMQTMLEALLENGIDDGKGGKVKPLAFAKVNELLDAELNAAVSIFGGTLWGVDLQTSQQGQSSQPNPVWDYVQSSEWGGHAIVDGEYDEYTKDAEVISWAKQVHTTAKFRLNQLQQAWIVVWEWNVSHPAFQAGIDLPALQQAFKNITGKDLGS